ncbi:hypothetical protein ROLI_045530 (plasmid) [Roseobacter fucihabitans]|uniref:Acyltransferase 3 domain-containing protein n=1 Tax=Roseobacter fucihabitans TaxID=1537242 RepID=A0ABZ2BZC6_9RHOB|nr:acyltransferase [Roseobacter litoralis]MBC6967865.1 Acyltransferase family protein [Roseobacter litoralis]
MQTLDGLQVLRFVAAFLVVIYHVQLGSAGVENFQGIFDFVQRGAAGVDIFFVISGFIIMLTMIRKPGFDVKNFGLNRFFCIYPTCWVFLTLAIILGYASYRLTGHSATYDMLSPSSLLVSYLLIPVQTQIFPVAWTLTLEISFYLIFCLFYWLMGLRGVIAYGTAVGGFFDGIGVGREFKWGLPAALLIYGAVGIPWKAPRFAILAGDSSYILYLMHPLLIATVNVLSARLLGINASTHNGLIILILVLSVLISMAMTTWIERPYIAWYKRRLAQFSGSAKRAMSRAGSR